MSVFCKGNCEKCGMLIEYTVTNNNEVKTLRKCVFHAMFESMCRQEQANVRIQSAIESSRNEQVTANNKINETVANGFIGLIKSVDDNKKKYIGRPHCQPGNKHVFLP